MASEPRNYPDYVFVACDEDFSAQTYDIAVSLEPGNLVGRPVKYIRHDLNTLPAPAATDTGLVTFSVEMLRDYAFMKADTEGDYVTRSQAESEIRKVRKDAEELLAAKEAERAEQWRLRREMEADRDTQKAIATSLEAELAAERKNTAEAIREGLKAVAEVRADNAAKDARIKELEAEIERMTPRSVAYDYLESPARADEAEAALKAAQDARVKELEELLAKFADKGTLQALKDANDRAEALEAKLAAAENALEPFADHANDRAVDDTGWRDKETVKIVVSIGDLRKARAVLGGKPS